MSQEPEYTVELIKEEDADNIMKLLKRTFYIDEPMNQAVKLYETGSCPDLDEYCSHALLEGLTYKAVDKGGKIVGVMISGIRPLKEDENGNDLLNQALRCKDPKFQKILHILAKREQGAKLWDKFDDERELVEVKVAATDPDWRKRGIMCALLTETEKATKERGIRLIRMDTSSAYSAMAAVKLNFTCIYKAPYAEIKLEGEPLIVPEPPHIEDRVYIKVLFDEP